MLPRFILTLTVALLAAAPPLARAALQVQPGIGFIAITGAAPNAVISLQDRRHKEITGVADRFGSLIFRDLAERRRYIVRDTAGGDPIPVTVLDFKDTPDASLYTGQRLQDGYQYIRMRDGTLLAAMVRAPLGKTLADGPFPTVVEYSGYTTADPGDVLHHAQPITLLSYALGYATVAVNMRGSGCSGGVLDLFDLPTTADGYDVIETVAAQPWVQGGTVGMVGISFSGISQLFVGGARPPHLAAITPLSVIADIYRAPGFPGGIFNNGFAQSWLQERKDDAEPAPEGGQGWAVKRVNDGDATCLANQKLRLQTLDPLEFVQTHPFFEPDLMTNRSPINWVADIKVPTFLADSWQDEQTGGDFASMLSRLPRRSDVKITLENGVHSSPLDPDILWNWLAFLDLYVAHRAPDPSRLGVIASIIYPSILGDGTPVPPLPADRFDAVTDYDQARTLFESDPFVRVLMENGGVASIAGQPAPTFMLAFDHWPPSEVKATAWYFGARGTLSPTHSRNDDSAVDGYHPDPAARPAQTLPGDGSSDSWAILPPYDWEPIVGNAGVAYASAALTDDVTIVGPGSVDLWLRSSAPDTDIQVTLSEIRPDGLEVYVQNGWLRASHRHLDRKTSTKLEPRPTHLERHARPLPAGQFAKVRVGLFAVAHTFRAGSRIRLGIEAPGGDRTRWRFDTPPTDGAVLNEVSCTRARPSRLVLPVVPGVAAPAALPPCPGLRGEPCRTYVAAANGG